LIENMVAPLTVYHNGSCSKSNGLLELLTEREVPFTARFYLDEPLTEEELKALLKKLDVPASAIVRRSEALIEAFTQEGEPDEESWVRILVANPSLIERPIVEAQTKAVVARPPERLFEIL
jgi:arsenate reductase